MSTSYTPEKVTVLIVEDEGPIRMLAVDLVEEAGFNALEAIDGDAAVRILEQRGDVRIVFADIDLPGALDGAKLAAAIRGRWPPISLILTSGQHFVSASDLPDRCIFIPKPYEARRVVATLLRLAAQYR